MTDLRFAIAGLGGGLAVAALTCAAFLAGAGDSLLLFCRAAEWVGGDFGLLIAVVIVAAAITLGPGALWYGCAIAILRLLPPE